MTWEGLSPPYATIVADPPWSYDAAFHGGSPRPDGRGHLRRGFPYSTLAISDIAALPVGDLAAHDAHLFLWTTNRYLPDAFTVLSGWGFRYSTTLVWMKKAMGLGLGGTFTLTTEFVLYGRRGKPQHLRRHDSTWFYDSRRFHSTKPASFGDMVEQVCPGPYVELFARQPRLGWDSWGFGYEAGWPENTFTIGFGSPLQRPVPENPA